MQTINQTGPECALATFAAIADRPYAEIRREACKIAGVKSWNNLFKAHRTEEDRHRRFYNAIRQLEHKYGIENFTSSLYGNRGVSEMAESYTDSDLKGRGTILIAGKGFSHIMPYEDGLVYDTNFETPVNLQDAVARYSNVEIRKVTHLMDTPEPIEIVDDNPRSRPCHNCGAEIGRPCRYPSGYHFSKGHAER